MKNKNLMMIKKAIEFASRIIIGIVVFVFLLAGIFELLNAQSTIANILAVVLLLAIIVIISKILIKSLSK